MFKGSPIFSITFFFLSITSVVGQNLDSLKKAAPQQTDAEKEFILYRKVSLAYKDSLPDSALLYAKHSLNAAIDTPLIRAQIFGYKLIGEVFSVIGNIDSASYYLKKGIAVAEADSNYYLSSSLHLKIGEAYRRVGQYSKAFEYWKSTVQYADSTDNPKMVARAFNNIGLLYYYLLDIDTGNAPKAIRYLKQALALKKEQGMNLASTYHNLGIVYNDIDENDTAYYYVKKAIPENKKANNNKWLTLNYIEIIDNLCEQNRFEEAFLYLDSAQQMIDTYQIYLYKYDFLTAKAFLYTETGKIKEAIEFAKQGLQGAIKTTDRELEWEATRLLKNNYYRLNLIDSAKKYENMHTAVSNEITNELLTAKTKSLQNEVDLVLQQKQIAILDQKSRINALEAKTAKRTIWLLSLVFIAILIGAFFVIVFIQQKRKLQEKLAEEQVKQVKQAGEIAQLQAVLNAQEEEKNKISSELHDHVGGSIAALKHRLERVKQHFEDYPQLIELVNGIATGVRNISHLLSAKKILSIGLKRAITHLAGHFNSDATIIKTYIEDIDPLLTDEQKVNIFRIAQELLTNIQKHAKANKVFVQLVKDENTVHFSVEDDGVGFDKAEKELDSGIGLGNVIDRIKSLNGEFEIDTHPGKGTSVTMQIPVNGTLA